MPKETLVIAAKFSFFVQGEYILVVLTWNLKEMKINQLKILGCSGFWKVNRKSLKDSVKALLGAEAC